jgi:hypothetical protein
MGSFLCSQMCCSVCASLSASMSYGCFFWISVYDLIGGRVQSNFPYWPKICRLSVSDVERGVEAKYTGIVVNMVFLLGSV